MALAYVRTISNSSHLGKYLSTICFGDVFDEEKSSPTFDKHGLLKAVIKYCPSITKINSYCEDVRLCNILSYAVTQGQLSHLKVLPLFGNGNLESYIFTALAFKNSLTELSICDSKHIFQLELANLAVYETLCDQIDEFKNLQSLRLVYTSNKYLSDFDALIDKCHSLKELHFDLTANEIQQSNELDLTIRPRPDIKTLMCNLEMIGTNSQLEYMMAKFTNLDVLNVENMTTVTENPPSFSSCTLMKFVSYVMSIPDFVLEIDVTEGDLLNIWMYFIKAKNQCKDLFITFDTDQGTLYNMSLSTERGLHIVFPPRTDEDEQPPHIRFLSEVGRSVRSLSAFGSEMILRKNGEVSNTAEGLFDILQLCPFIEEITSYDPRYMTLSNHTLKYDSVKKLTIGLTSDLEFCHFLTCVSFNLPNIQQIFIEFTDFDNKIKGTVTIDMPFTSLDLLRWQDDSYETNDCSGQIYIKLRTERGLRFYLGIRHKLFIIDQKRYNAASKYIRFDINCKRIKEFRVAISRFPEYNSNFIFTSILI